MSTLDKSALRQLVAQSEIGAICIDTNIFEAQDFGFDRGVLSQLINIKGSGIELLVPDVLEAEIVRHMEKKAQEAIGPLRKTLRAAERQGLITQESDALVERISDFSAFARSRFDAFADRVSMARIKVSDHADLEDVLERYAEELPPFEARKKSEFPDAFALSCLEGWASDNQTSVVVVSDDKGWHDYCSDSESVHSAPSLTDVIGALQVAQPVLLQRALASLVAASYSDFERMLSDVISDADVDVQAHSYHRFDYEVAEIFTNSISLSPAAIGDSVLIGADHEQFVVQLDVEIELGLVINFSFEIYDSVDRDYVPMGWNEVIRDEKVVVPCLVHFEYDHSDDGDVAITQVELVERGISVDVGEVEMDLGEPDDD